jgi:Lar family restriction alleviation protein
MSTNSTTANVKPCPFCGAPDPAIDEIDIGVFALVCEGCGAIGPHPDESCPPERAIAEWNHRV